MPEFTRRRDQNRDQEHWLIYFRDVRIDSIGLRAGVPNEAPSWGWACGFVRAGGANVREPIDGNGERQERCVNTSIEHHPLRHNIVKDPRLSSPARFPMILELYRALPTAAAKSIRAQGF